MPGDAGAWGVIGAAILTAGAALGGVVLTQRAQRRHAHEDRLWEKRTSAYVDLLSWADDLQDRLQTDRDSVTSASSLDQLRRAAQQPQVRAFGSQAVAHQLRNVWLALAGLIDVSNPLSMSEYAELEPDEVPGAMRAAQERSVAHVIKELTTLEEVVRAELQPFESPTSDRGRLPWRIRLRRARRQLLGRRHR